MSMLGSGDDQPTDGKIKGRPSARLMWLVGLGNLSLTPTVAAGASTDFSNKINLPSAITLTAVAVSGDDNA
jgi:hypothetical protein